MPLFLRCQIHQVLEISSWCQMVSSCVFSFEFDSFPCRQCFLIMWQRFELRHSSKLQWKVTWLTWLASGLLAQKLHTLHHTLLSVLLRLGREDSKWMSLTHICNGTSIFQANGHRARGSQQEAAIQRQGQPHQQSKSSDTSKLKRKCKMAIPDNARWESVDFGHHKF